MDSQQARAIDHPEPGHFRIRLVKNGPWVPACIRMEPPRDPITGEFLDRSFRLVPYLIGVPIMGRTQDRWSCRIWNFGRPITKGDHDYLVDWIRWARVNEPHRPECHPRRSIDPAKGQVMRIG